MLLPYLRQMLTHHAHAQPIPLLPQHELHPPPHIGGVEAALQHADT